MNIKKKSDLLHRPFRLGELLFEIGVKTIAFSCIAAILLIFAFTFRESIPMLFGIAGTEDSANPIGQSEIYGGTDTDSKDLAAQFSQREVVGGGEASLSNLASSNWHPVSLQPQYGLIALVVGSLKVTLIAILIAAPLGILAALYTSAFAPRWARELLKPAIEILAGFPSVVIGFFALIVLATFFQDVFGFEYRLNAFVGGVALSIAVIPIIFTITEDSLTTVPKSYIEASLALGISKWQTALYVTLPAATPGVLAAVILGFGRAFGETMIVLMATGNAALVSSNMFEPVRTMSATIGAEMAEVVFGDTHYRVLFFIGSILFVVTFGLNAIAEFYVRQRLLRRFRGSS